MLKRYGRSDGALFSPEFPVIGTEEVKILITALIGINVRYLLDHPESPSIRSAGVRFRREKSDKYLSIRFLLQTLRGDCEDLVAADVAERLLKGEECWFDVVSAGSLPDGSSNFHVVLTFPDGSTHDTAVELGARRR